MQKRSADGSKGRHPARGSASPQPFPAGTVIDFSRYIPTVLSRLVSHLRANANDFFQTAFDISLFEWRVISALGAAGPMTAYAIWTEGGLDKAAVSRALKALQARGLLSITDGPKTDGRRRTNVSLTESGRELHERTLAEVIARHARLVDGIPVADLETLLRTLARIEARIPEMASERRSDADRFCITTEAKARR